MKVNSVVPDHNPRYILTKDGLWILDRWDGHREVYRAPHSETPRNGWIIPSGSREGALALCAKWNAEHDAWMAAG